MVVDDQRVVGYPVDKPGAKNPNIVSANSPQRITSAFGTYRAIPDFGKNEAHLGDGANMDREVGVWRFLCAVDPGYPISR